MPSLTRWFAIAALLLIAPAGCVSTGDIDTSAMSFSSEPLVGKVVWNDLVTEDLDAARRFYGEVFGWTFENTTNAAGNPYALAKSGNVYVAGIVSIAARNDGAKLSRWLPYVSVTDVDAAVSRATAANARVAVAARDVRVGRAAAIIDPEGAVIGLARSRIGDPDDATTKAAVNRVVWTELISGNPQAAAEFYRSVIGFDVSPIERRGGQYTMLLNKGVQRAGVLKKPVDQWDSVWLTYFGVPDPAAAAARAQSFGGKVLLPASPEVREGSMAIVSDPSGAILVLQRVPS